MLSQLETEEEKEQANRKSAAAAVLRRLDPLDEDKGDEGNQGTAAGTRRPRKEDLVLNQYEQIIAMDVVAPEDIPVQFDGMRPPLIAG